MHRGTDDAQTQPQSHAWSSNARQHMVMDAPGTCELRRSAHSGPPRKYPRTVRISSSDAFTAKDEGFKQQHEGW